MSEASKPTAPQVLLATCGGYWLHHVARAFESRGMLAGLWLAARKKRMVSPPINLPADRVRCCQVFHLAMMPFYSWAPQIWTERMFYAFLPIWQAWFRLQPSPDCNVVQAIMGFATEPFDRAERIGALKVIDCPNSHPLSYYGFWQRECDIWCPGERVPIPHWMFARMNRELERANLIIVQSKFCKESMVYNGLPAERVMVNPMGVDVSIFKPRTTVPVKARFISVGTICLRKGHQYLFRAFEIVKRRLPEAELICVGGYKQDFRLQRPQWEGSFTHHEGLNHSQVADLLRTSTAFVFPSQEEGIARAQVEALACALPVVGTHEGGATTLVEDGVEGFIVRGRDPAHLAQAMIRLAEDRELNRRMGEAAYRKGAVRNTWQDYSDRLLAEYEARLNHRQAPAVIG
jgi:glycosyltransferase involved in cell wall biosynthesis